MFKGLLFTGDIHLRPDVPLCRTDDFQAAQWAKFKQIHDIARRNNLVWIDAGDIFEKAQPSLAFVNKAIKEIKEPIMGVMGNHDMPAHNLNRMEESGWGTLYLAEKIVTLLGPEPVYVNLAEHIVAEIYGACYGEPIPEPYDPQYGVIKILVMHEMVYPSRNAAIPNAPGCLAKKLLRDNKEYSIIVTGHNHQSFHVELDGRLLINVGSMTRQTADQMDHIPRVAMFKDRQGLQWLTLDHKPGVVSREHIEKQEQKEEELTAFVQSLQDVDEVSLSFEDNVDRVIHETKPGKPVEEKVREAMQ